MVGSTALDTIGLCEKHKGDIPDVSRDVTKGEVNMQRIGESSVGEEIRSGDGVG